MNNETKEFIRYKVTEFAETYMLSNTKFDISVIEDLIEKKE